MGEIVNLRRVKRLRAREAAAVEAAEKRARHGTTRAEKIAEAKRHALAQKRLDGAALSGDGEAGEVAGEGFVDRALEPDGE